MIARTGRTTAPWWVNSKKPEVDIPPMRDAQAIFRHDVAQLALVRTGPVVGATLEVRHVLPRHLHGFGQSGPRFSQGQGGQQLAVIDDRMSVEDMEAIREVIQKKVDNQYENVDATKHPAKRKELSLQIQRLGLKLPAIEPTPQPLPR